MKTLFRSFVTAISVLLVASCTSVSEEDLILLEDPISNDEVTYTANIQPIMANVCNECHRNPPINGAPFPLLTFDEVQTRANRILIRMDEGTMPPSGRLPQSNIDLVRAWIENGTPE